MRQVFLDTETTGLYPAQGHRIIEIAAIEAINRRVTNNHFHVYLNPDREIDAGAQEVHGITLEFLQDKPRFSDVVTEFLDFVADAELVIHNAPFDMGFLNSELGKIGRENLEKTAGNIIDTLKMAKDMRPGQRNNLDALCRHYGIDNSKRTLHGALLDAELLAEVYMRHFSKRLVKRNLCGVLRSYWQQRKKSHSMMLMLQRSIKRTVFGKKV